MCKYVQICAKSRFREGGISRRRGILREVLSKFFNSKNSLRKFFQSSLRKFFLLTRYQLCGAVKLSQERGDREGTMDLLWFFGFHGSVRNWTTKPLNCLNSIDFVFVAATLSLSDSSSFLQRQSKKMKKKIERIRKGRTYKEVAWSSNKKNGREEFWRVLKGSVYDFCLCRCLQARRFSDLLGA